MITLHYLNSSRAHRILWLLEELKLPYEIKVWYRHPKTMRAPRELKEIHPSGKSPIIVDGDITVAESGLICEYLVSKYGKGTPFEPTSPQDELNIKYGLYASEGNMMSSAFQLFIFSIAKKTSPWGVATLVGAVVDRIADAYANKELKTTLVNLQELIKANDGYHTGGRITAADVMYETVIAMIVRDNLVPNFEEEYPGIVEWRARLVERPAYQKARAAEPKTKL